MKKIVTPLLKWYQENKRELPWRKDQSPYHIWISEIMLQQTRIEAVIDYYKRFLEEIPDIKALAEVKIDKLLKLWEGLGYYNRARNLQKSAQIIIEKYGGIFPKTYEEILSLPGIGEYTASAISSICYNLKEVTVDGNVLRVYMRLKNAYDNVDDNQVKKQVRKELMKIIPEEAGNFNQGMMELGETICLPNGTPKCEICPLKKYCLSYYNNTVEELPIKNPKKNKKEEKITILLFYHKEKFLLSKRLEKGLLSHLWQFPNVEGHLTVKQLKEYLKQNKINYQKIEKTVQYTHIFTHKKWNMISYLIELKELDHNKNWITLNQLEDKALPTAFLPFMKVLEEVLKHDET